VPADEVPREPWSEGRVFVAGLLRRPCRAQIAPLRSDNSVYLAGRERLIEGMRKAGVPEG
jgi:hypothetical protein